MMNPNSKINGPIEVISPKDEAELSAFVADSFARGTPLRIAGGGTRLDLGALNAQQTLTSRALTGVVTYEPGALTLIARAGTPLEEVEQTLEAEGQALAFEPMDHRGLLGSSGVPTIGGVVAANVSGPRRLQAGACRDHLLGVRFVDGRGRKIKNGGRVMKNVTGLDLSKLICGSFGTLGVLTEVALKTLPRAEGQLTLVFSKVSLQEACTIFASALATPYEVSGAVYHQGSAWLRVEGFAQQAAYRADRLKALFREKQIDVIADEESRPLWRGFKNVEVFAQSSEPLWRILIKPSEAPALARSLQLLGGDVFVDWGGGLVWYCGPAQSAEVRSAASAGRAVLIRQAARPASDRFPEDTGAISRLSAALRKTFDPAGILNPKLMGD
jgi:glycolate oxidase FAD binding subunit